MGIKEAEGIGPIDEERMLRLWRKAILDASPGEVPLHGINFSKLIQEETIQRVATYIDNWFCNPEAKCKGEHCAGLRSLQKNLRELAGAILR